jgi:hypothetical protein
VPVDLEYHGALNGQFQMNQDEEKRKNHYVPQFYLREWSVDKIWIDAEIGGRSRSMRIAEIAYANYFYKVLPIAPGVAEMLRHEAKSLGPVMDDHAEAVINYASMLWAAREESEERFNDADRMSTLPIENFYGVIEDCFLDALPRLRAQEIDKFSLADYDNVMRFVVFQLGRTLAAARRTEEYIGEITSQNGIEFDSYHRISNLIMCSRLHKSLVNQLYRFVLIVNETDEPFVTTDDPAFNQNGFDVPEARLFMPLGPWLAIEICANPLSREEHPALMAELTSTTMLNRDMVSVKPLRDLAEIAELNDRLREKAERFVFTFPKGTGISLS